MSKYYKKSLKHIHIKMLITFFYMYSTVNKGYLEINFNNL